MGMKGILGSQQNQEGEKGVALLPALFFALFVVMIIGGFLLLCNRDWLSTHKKKQKNEAVYLAEAITNWVIEEMTTGGELRTDPSDDLRKYVKDGTVGIYYNNDRSLTEKFLQSKLRKLIDEFNYSSSQPFAFGSNGRFADPEISLEGKNKSDVNKKRISLSNNNYYYEMTLADYNNYPKEFYITVKVVKRGDSFLKARSKTKVSFMPDHVCNYGFFLPTSSELRFSSTELGSVDPTYPGLDNLTVHGKACIEGRFGPGSNSKGNISAFTPERIASFASEKLELTHNVVYYDFKDWLNTNTKIIEFANEKEYGQKRDIQAVHDDPGQVRWPWMQGEQIGGGSFEVYLNKNFLDIVSPINTKDPQEKITLQGGKYPEYDYCQGPLLGYSADTRGNQPRSFNFSYKYTFCGITVDFKQKIGFNPAGGYQEDGHRLPFPDDYLKSPIKGIPVRDYEESDLLYQELDYHNFRDIGGPKTIPNPYSPTETVDDRIYTYVGREAAEVYIMEELDIKNYAFLPPRTIAGITQLPGDLYDEAERSGAYYYIKNRKHEMEIKDNGAGVFIDIGEKKWGYAPKDVRRYDLNFIRNLKPNPTDPNSSPTNSGIFFLFNGDLIIKGGFPDCSLTIATSGNITIEGDIVNTKYVPNPNQLKPEVINHPHQVGIIANSISITEDVNIICASLMCSKIEITGSSSSTPPKSPKSPLNIYGSLVLNDIVIGALEYDFSKKTTYIINPNQNRKRSSYPPGFYFLDFDTTILSEYFY
ncbi:MAG: hypothetical protein V1872_08605 [bacterium]